jgi:hypothetical protein
MIKVRMITVAVLVAGAAAAAGWMHRSPGVADSEESPEQAHWRQFSERCASDSMRTLTLEEATYAEREQDREWCHVNDFWASNVGELYTMTSASAATGDKDSTIRLIELSVASAHEESETPD